MIREQDKDIKLTQTKYRLIRTGVVVLTFILLLAVAIVPGVLRILYRADAQVALGHAKSVRLVLQMTGKESYGGSRSFCDASREGASQRASVHLCNPPEAISSFNTVKKKRYEMQIVPDSKKDSGTVTVASFRREICVQFPPPSGV